MNPARLVYCDESFNDGPNYLNARQPFYVIAGWIVAEADIVAATVEMENLRQKYCRDAEELAFGIFKRRPWIVSESMKRLGQIGLVPVYVIAEKRYCVADKIVETFLDPAYNPKLNGRFTIDLLTKQEIANTLYEKMSDTTLSRFAEAYRAPTQAGLENALAAIAVECRNCVNPEMAELIEGSITRLAEIAADEVEAVSSWGRASGTLNLPCLISFMMLIEELGRKQSYSFRKIVHDEQGSYQADYLRAFHQHRDAEDQRVFLEGMRVPYGAIRMIGDFEVQRSVEQPMIQAADLLAGSISHLATALLDGRKLHPPEIELGGLVLPPLLFNELVIAKPVCSDRMLKRFGKAIHLAYPQVAATEPVAVPVPDIRWTSTLPGEGDVPLPLLPVPSVEEARETPTHSVKIDLPIYGICDEAGRLTVLLPPEKAFAETAGLERCVPLWCRRASAEAFYAEQPWDVPQQLIEFGPKEMPELIARLQKAAEWTDYVRFNMFDDDEAPIPILPFAADLQRVWDRIVRSCQSGILDTLAKNETLNGHEVFTVLLAHGGYAALKKPSGPKASGRTREEAISNLMAILD
jgi:hypothetical protein